MALSSTEKEEGSLFLLERGKRLCTRENKLVLSPFEIRELPSLIWPCSLHKEESPYPRGSRLWDLLGVGD